VSTEQRETLDTIRRQSAFPADMDVSELRRLLAELTSAQPLPADVEVTLDITPGVPHVFQADYPILDEAAAALDRAGQFLSAHLTGSQTTGGWSS
jgi:hypothetical protein